MKSEERIALLVGYLQFYCTSYRLAQVSVLFLGAETYHIHVRKRPEKEKRVIWTPLGFQVQCIITSPLLMLKVSCHRM